MTVIGCVCCKVPYPTHEKQNLNYHEVQWQYCDVGVFQWAAVWRINRAGPEAPRGSGTDWGLHWTAEGADRPVPEQDTDLSWQHPVCLSLRFPSHTSFDLILCVFSVSGPWKHLYIFPFSTYISLVLLWWLFVTHFMNVFLFFILYLLLLCYCFLPALPHLCCFISSESYSDSRRGTQSKTTVPRHKINMCNWSGNCMCMFRSASTNKHIHTHTCTHAHAHTGTHNCPFSICLSLALL